MKHWKTKYFKQFIAGMIGYGFLLPLTIKINNQGDMETTSRMLLVLAPMIPLIIAISAVIKNFQDMDEFWKKVLLESFLLTAAITAFSTFSVGLLQVNDFVPLVPMVLVLPYMVSIWGLSVFFTRKKYLS